MFYLLSFLHTLFQGGDGVCSSAEFCSALPNKCPCSIAIYPLILAFFRGFWPIFTVFLCFLCVLGHFFQWVYLSQFVHIILTFAFFGGTWLITFLSWWCALCRFCRPPAGPTTTGTTKTTPAQHRGLASACARLTGSPQGGRGAPPAPASPQACLLYTSPSPRDS